jgi:hypothetical protein
MIQKMSEVMKMKEDREKLSNSCIELAWYKNTLICSNFFHKVGQRSACSI